MSKSRKKKLAQREQRQKPVLSAVNPLVAAHQQLDDWIAGKITSPHAGQFENGNAGGSGIIWLGPLKDTMLRAREFYQAHADILRHDKSHYQSNSAGTRPVEPTSHNLTELRGTIDYIAKSHACTQVNFDDASAEDYPKMLDAIMGAVRKYLSAPHTGPAAAASVTMENKRGEWVPAIPMPLFGLKKGCSCGRKFWKLRNYEAHYAYEHIVLGELPL